MENELDLQEQTRRDDVYNDLNKIVDQLTALPVFPSLLWVWTFDVLRNIFEDNKEIADTMTMSFQRAPHSRISLISSGMM
jgi:hypothetical protein